MPNRNLHRFAVLLAGCTLILVVAGALVTSHEAGLSVPDWPLSYGRIMPEMVGGVFYEHGHRLIASAVGLLTVVLAIWMTVSNVPAWLKKLSYAAVGMVILQGLLGGLTVLLSLPKAVSILHACLAQLFFSLTCVIALFTSESFSAPPRIVEDTGSPSLRRLAILAPHLILIQIALGAAFRHKALGIIPHVLGAMVVLILVMYAAIAVITSHPDHGPLRRSAVVLLSLTTVQVFLGVGAYVSRVVPSSAGAMIGSTVAHVAVGALTMASSVIMAIQVARHTRLREQMAVLA